MKNEFKNCIELMGTEEFLARLSRKGGVGFMRDAGRQVYLEWIIDNDPSYVQALETGNAELYWQSRKKPSDD